MSDKTNDEKLRILQERLAHIKEKQEIPVSPRKQAEKVIEIATPNNKTPAKNKRSAYSSWISKTILIGAIAYGVFHVYNNIDFNSLTSSEPNTEEIELVEKKIEYNLDLNGDNIAIAATFEDENSAKVMANNLKVEGFKADYFYLPNKSNSTKEVYKVFIGPYENEKETNQWTENIESETEIIKL